MQSRAAFLHIKREEVFCKTSNNPIASRKRSLFSYYHCLNFWASSRGITSITTKWNKNVKIHKAREEPAAGSGSRRQTHFWQMFEKRVQKFWGSIKKHRPKLRKTSVAVLTATRPKGTSLQALARKTLSALRLWSTCTQTSQNCGVNFSGLRKRDIVFFYGLRRPPFLLMRAIFFCALKQPRLVCFQCK
jgi:hypothetical protein